jgi:hypothetical protein
MCLKFLTDQYAEGNEFQFLEILSEYCEGMQSPSLIGPGLGTGRCCADFPRIIFSIVDWKSETGVNPMDVQRGMVAEEDKVDVKVS